MNAGIEANVLRKPRKNWPNLPLLTKMRIAEWMECVPNFRRDQVPGTQTTSFERYRHRLKASFHSKVPGPK
jgi:hypothetical protein